MHLPGPRPVVVDLLRSAGRIQFCFRMVHIFKLCVYVMFINSSQAFVLENLDKKLELWETLLGGTKYHVLSANPVWLLPSKARQTKGVCWYCTWRRLHNLLLCLLYHTCSPVVMDDSVSFFLKCHNKCWSCIDTTIRPSGFKSQLVFKQAQWPFADVFDLKITDFCSCCIDTSLYRWYLQGKLPPYVQGVKNIYIKNIC